MPCLGPVPGKITIRTTTGCNWDIKVKYVNGKAILDQGWPWFVIAHELGIRHLLFLKKLYAKDYRVVIFESCCEVVKKFSEHQESFKRIVVEEEWVFAVWLVMVLMLVVILSLCQLWCWCSSWTNLWLLWYCYCGLLRINSSYFVFVYMVCLVTSSIVTIATVLLLQPTKHRYNYVRKWNATNQTTTSWFFSRGAK